MGDTEKCSLDECVQCQELGDGAPCCKHSEHCDCFYSYANRPCCDCGELSPPTLKEKSDE